YGEDKVAFVVSPKLTNEELLTIKSIVKELDSHYKGSFTIDEEPGIERVLGKNQSTINFEQLDAADLIVSVGQLYEHHPSMGMKLRRLSNNKNIISASIEPTKANKWAAKADVQHYEAFFAQVLKALIDKDVIKADLLNKYPN